MLGTYTMYLGNLYIYYIPLPSLVWGHLESWTGPLGRDERARPRLRLLAARVLLSTAARSPPMSEHVN